MAPSRNLPGDPLPTWIIGSGVPPAADSASILRNFSCCSTSPITPGCAVAKNSKLTRWSTRWLQSDAAPGSRRPLENLEGGPAAIGVVDDHAGERSAALQAASGEVGPAGVRGARRGLDDIDADGQPRACHYLSNASSL